MQPKFHKKEKDKVGAGDDDPGEDIETFSPQAGIIFDYSDSLSIYGSVGKKVRFPTMRNLYADGVIGPEGNPDLKEEKAYNFELGCNWMVNGNIEAEMAVFYSNIENLINFDNIIGNVFFPYKPLSHYIVRLILIFERINIIINSIYFVCIHDSNREQCHFY